MHWFPGNGNAQSFRTPHSKACPPCAELYIHLGHIRSPIHSFIAIFLNEMPHSRIVVFFQWKKLLPKLEHLALSSSARCFPFTQYVNADFKATKRANIATVVGMKSHKIVRARSQFFHHFKWIRFRFSGLEKDTICVLQINQFKWVPERSIYLFFEW